MEIEAKEINDKEYYKFVKKKSLNAAVSLFMRLYLYSFTDPCEKTEKSIAFFVKIFYDIKEYICF